MSSPVPSHAGPHIPYHSILSRPRCSSPASHNRNPMFKSPSIKEFHRSHSCAFTTVVLTDFRPRCGPLHRGHCAVNIQKATSWSPPKWQCISHCQPMNDESGEPPATQNGCTTVVSTVYNETRNVHRRGCPVISLLQCMETGKFVQNVVFMSQVVQPLTTPITFFLC